jgi:hypothetical protein
MESSQARSASLSRCADDSPKVVACVFKSLAGFLAAIDGGRLRAT